MAKYGVTVLKGGVAYTPAEAEAVAKELGGPIWVVKSQIHAGGRGKGKFKGKENDGGGVRVRQVGGRGARERGGRCWARSW